MIAGLLIGICGVFGGFGVRVSKAAQEALAVARVGFRVGRELRIEFWQISRQISLCKSGVG